jgi:hypothetical protein
LIYFFGDAGFEEPFGGLFPLPFPDGLPVVLGPLLGRDELFAITLFELYI